MSSWWIGESSDGSLLKLWRRRFRSDSGYGEPQLAVPNRLSLALWAGGVLSSSKARSGSLGAGRGGRTGDDSISSSPSTVDAVERAGDAGDAGREREAPEPSCAGAAGG